MHNLLSRHHISTMFQNVDATQRSVKLQNTCEDEVAVTVSCNISMC